MTLLERERAAEAEAAAAPFSIVCLSPQGWGEGLPTNRQQIMRQAIERGHAVVFVHTGPFFGRQLPRLARAHGLRRLATAVLGGTAAAPRLRLAWAPNVAPFGHSWSAASRVNSFLTAWLVRRLARTLPPPVVLWLFDPCMAHVLGRHRGELAVYDCVDDYAEAAAGARTRALLAAADRTAAAAADVVFTTASPLFERHRSVNRRTHLVRNVGDYRHFSPAADASLAPPDLRALRRPVLGFAGNLVPTKVDFELLESVAATRPNWTILLVGPAAPAGAAALARLAERPNVRWLGPKSYEELPPYVAAFDVALIPYVANAYTRSCFPLKVFEYLAAGKPVVASALPELAGMEPDVVVRDGTAAFAAAVEEALRRSGDDDRRRRMALAAANTWESRADTLLGLVARELAA